MHPWRLVGMRHFRTRMAHIKTLLIINCVHVTLLLLTMIFRPSSSIALRVPFTGFPISSHNVHGGPYIGMVIF